MTGTLNKNERRYLVTLSLLDGNQFSFGVEHLPDVLDATRERTSIWEVGYYLIREEKVTRPTLLAGDYTALHKVIGKER